MLIQRIKRFKHYANLNQPQIEGNYLSPRNFAAIVLWLVSTCEHARAEILPIVQLLPRGMPTVRAAYQKEQMEPINRHMAITIYVNSYVPTAISSANLVGVVVEIFSDCQHRLPMVAPKTMRTQNLSCRSMIAILLNHWFEIKTQTGRPSADETRAVSSCSRLPLLQVNDECELHYAHCRTSGSARRNK